MRMPKVKRRVWAAMVLAAFLAVIDTNLLATQAQDHDCIPAWVLAAAEPSTIPSYTWDTAVPGKCSGSPLQTRKCYENGKTKVTIYKLWWHYVNSIVVCDVVDSSEIEIGNCYVQ